MCLAANLYLFQYSIYIQINGFQTVLKLHAILLLSVAVTDEILIISNSSVAIQST